MLTPVEMQGKVLKTGFGYKKKETDDFLEEIFESYEQVYKENAELKEKLAVLNDGLQYYKDLEGTLQKTLLVAEKTAESTKNASLKKAAAIEKNATVKAQMTLSDAKKTMDKIQQQTVVLMQQFENYRQQYKQILNAQMELIESKAYTLPAFEPINLEIPDIKIEDAFASATEEAFEEEMAAEAEEIAEQTEEKEPSEAAEPAEPIELPEETASAEETEEEAEALEADEVSFEFLDI